MITLDQQIKSVKREIALREAVYPKWVAAKRMKQDAADHEIAAMKAVLVTLEGLRAEQQANEGTLNKEAS